MNSYIKEIYKLANKIKKELYGDRIVTFALQMKTSEKLLRTIFLTSKKA